MPARHEHNTSATSHPRAAQNPAADRGPVLDAAINRHDLLTRAQEVDLASRLGSAHAAAWDACLPRAFARSAAARRWVLGVGADAAGLPRSATLAQVVAEDSAAWSALRAAQEAALALCDTLVREDVVAGRTDRRTALAAWRTSVLATRATLAHCLNGLVAPNLRLVVYVARRIRAQGHVRLGLDDLIQEGNIGLTKAARRFDPARGLRFATFAIWWIRHHIVRADENTGREIRVPTHACAKATILHRITREWHTHHGEDPTVADLAAATGWKVAMVERILAIPTQQVVSLDSPLRGFDDATLHDTAAAADGEAPSPEEALAEQEQRARVRDAVASLSPREREVLARRYGLEALGGPPDGGTLAEVGVAMGVSRQAIEQAEKKAKARVRGMLTCNASAVA